MFIETPVSKSSLSHRKPVHGIGINNASYITGRGSNICPFYRRWKDMLKRCYSDKFHITRPTYAECSVTSDWLTFSNFKDWMSLQEWDGMHLDKDIINPGNKIYAPDSCVFISRDLNNLLGDHRSRRGAHPQGVHFCKNDRKYQAYCNISGKRKHLGVFASSSEASGAYRNFKSRHIMAVAQEYRGSASIYAGLMKHAELILNG